MTSRLADPRLLLPGLPPLHVPRQRLIAALNEARDSPLTLVAAGPGAGKTVLLSEWAHSQDYPVAWITVTPAENEPPRFWRLFLSAVRAANAWDNLPRSVRAAMPRCCSSRCSHAAPHREPHSPSSSM